MPAKHERLAQGQIWEEGGQVGGRNWAGGGWANGLGWDAAISLHPRLHPQVMQPQFRYSRCRSKESLEEAGATLGARAASSAAFWSPMGVYTN